MYQDTVEADVYLVLRRRIGLFQGVVGKLQPILARVAHNLESAVLAGGEVAPLDEGTYNADHSESHQLLAEGSPVFERMLALAGVEELVSGDRSRRARHACRTSSLTRCTENEMGPT